MDEAKIKQQKKVLVAAVSTFVVIVVAVGLYLAGSPAEERRRQIDQQRANALQEISNAVDTVYATDGKLPESLDALIARAHLKNDIYLGSTVDPITGAPYELHATGASEYELCATFQTDTSSDYDTYGNLKPRAVPPMAVPVGYPGYRSWDHGVGRTCFTLDAISRGPTVACSLTNPCMAPNTICAQLPSRGTYCVLKGTECQAAGCAADQCTIGESFPVQVSCTGQTSCNLMRETKSGKIDCFGCGGKICKDPGPGWVMYTPPGKNGQVGIPYACFSDKSGACALAQ